MTKLMHETSNFTLLTQNEHNSRLWWTRKWWEVSLSDGTSQSKAYLEGEEE
jgi:hypothetical protein